MAAEGDTEMDYPAHEKSYSLFSRLMKWGTIISFIAAAIAVLLIS